MRLNQVDWKFSAAFSAYCCPRVSRSLHTAIPMPGNFRQGNGDGDRRRSSAKLGNVELCSEMATCYCTMEHNLTSVWHHHNVLKWYTIWIHIMLVWCMILDHTTATMWIKQCEKPSPSHHHLYRWYGYHSQSWVVNMALFYLFYPHYIVYLYDTQIYIYIIRTYIYIYT